MDAAVLPSDDGSQAPGEPLRYVKESLSSIRRVGGAVTPLPPGDEPVFELDYGGAGGGFRAFPCFDLRPAGKIIPSLFPL